MKEKIRKFYCKLKQLLGNHFVNKKWSCNRKHKTELIIKKIESITDIVQFCIIELNCLSSFHFSVLIELLTKLIWCLLIVIQRFVMNRSFQEITVHLVLKFEQEKGKDCLHEHCYCCLKRRYWWQDGFWASSSCICSQQCMCKYTLMVRP